MTDKDKNFDSVVRDAVQKELLSKETIEKLEKAEELVKSAEDTISELTDILSERDGEIAALADEKKKLLEQLSALELKTKELQERIDDADRRVGEMEQRAKASEETLAGIAKDRSLEVRVRELEEAKILKSGEKLEAQKNKVRDMSDEEFAAYKEDLVELRLAVEEALKKEIAGEPEPEGDVDVAPADLDKARKEDASLPLDVELELGSEENDLKNKYKQLGDTLAKSLRKDK